MRRLILALALFVLVVAAVVSFLYFHATYDLQDAIAEADRLDPGWRLEDLEARRAVIPDEENAALHILAVEKLFPAWWPTWLGGPFTDRHSLAKSIGELPPNAALTAPQLTAMNDAWAAAAEAVAAARKLKDMPRGRFPLVRDAQGMVLPGYGSQRVADLLHYDALLRGHDQEIGAALESCRGYVNVGRSRGDEPNQFAQQERMQTRAEACRLIERVLAQGTATDAGLAALQKLVEDEEAQPVFLYGARGLRVYLHDTLEGVADGRIKAPELPSGVSYGLAMNLQPASLRMTTRLVEVAKLPVEDQQQALDQGGRPQANEGPYFARMFIVPKIQREEYFLSHGQIRTQAELRCLIVALAAERHRLKHGAWPATAAALVPEYLRVVPIDPYDRQPVRYQRVKDGLVIYCVGPDRTDDAGKLDRRGRAPAGTDVGVQLWDTDQRRRAAPGAGKATGD